MLATFSSKMGGADWRDLSPLLDLCYFSILGPSWPPLGAVWPRFWRVWGSILDVFQEGVSSIWEVFQKGDPNFDGSRDLLKSLNGGAPRRGTQLDG